MEDRQKKNRQRVKPPPKIAEHCYTKHEVDVLIEEAIDDAIRKHNRNASIVSMILGFIFLAAFLDGFFRTIGLIPPFMGIDVNLIKNIVESVKDDVLNKVSSLPIPSV